MFFYRILQQLKSPTANQRARALVILKYLTNFLPKKVQKYTFLLSNTTVYIYVYVCMYHFIRTMEECKELH